MKDSQYKLGIYFDRCTVRQQMFGIGLVWLAEKYIHINLFNFEIAIGRTAR